MHDYDSSQNVKIEKLTFRLGYIDPTNRKRAKDDGFFTIPRSICLSTGQRGNLYGNSKIVVNDILSGRLKEDMCVEALVQVRRDPKFGYQFQTGGRGLIINDVNSIRLFLQGFEGIGPATVDKLMGLYGDRTLDMLQSHHDQVEQDCRAFSKNTQNKIKKLCMMASQRSLALYLKRCFPHLTDYMVEQIEKTGMFGHNETQIYKRIAENPYCLLKIRNVSFAKVDQVALADVRWDCNHSGRRKEIFKQAFGKFMKDHHCICVKYKSSEEDMVYSYCSGEGCLMRLTQLEALEMSFWTMYINASYKDACNEQDPVTRRVLNQDSDLFLTWLQEERALGHILVEQTDGHNFYYYLPEYKQAMDFVVSSVVSMMEAEKSDTIQKYLRKAGLRFEQWKNEIYPGSYGKKRKDVLDESQLSAIKNIVTHHFSILTGGPGRGKTSCVRELIHLWRSTGGRLIVLAPTGKAVNRLRTEVGCADAETIDALLTRNRVLRNDSVLDQNSIETVNGERVSLSPSVLVIVDESSMISLTKAAELFGFFSKCNMVFCGDADQLPPIDPGAFFYETIYSMGVPCFELVHNYRMESPKIMENAEQLCKLMRKSEQTLKAEGASYVMIEGPEFQRRHFPISQSLPPWEKQNVVDAVYKEYLRIAKREDCSFSDVLCIAPTNKLVEALNQGLQQKVQQPNWEKYQSRFDQWEEGDGLAYNSARCYKTYPGYEVPNIFGSSDTRRFYVGDRVMNTTNDAAHSCRIRNENGEYSARSGIFNGDFGTIDRLAFSKQTGRFEGVTVVFDDGRIADIEPETFFNQFRLGYAMTIHKAQGSEAKYVFLVFADNMWLLASGFLNQKLSYTAITRAKKGVILFGCTNYFEASAKNAYKYHNLVYRHVLSRELLKMKMKAQMQRGD